MAATRRHDIDALRNLAIGYLFVFHTARVFDADEPFYVQGAPNQIATTVVRLSFAFMPLLFVLAGMSSRYALRRRTPREFAHERLVRLGVPLGIGIVLVVPPQAYVARVWHEGAWPPVGGFLREYWTDFSDLSGYFGTWTPAHLWFIAFLLGISLALAPLLGRARAWRLPAWVAHPAALVAVAGLALEVLGAVPDLGGQNIVAYAGFVLGGFLLAGDERLEATVLRWRWGYLGLALACAAGLEAEHRLAGPHDGYSWAAAGFGLLRAVAVVSAVLAMLGLARRFLDRPSRLSGRATTLAYPVYVLHQTVLVVVAALVLAGHRTPWYGYPVIALASFAVTVALVEGASRVRVLRWALGMKAAPVAATQRPQPQATPM